MNIIPSTCYPSLNQWWKNSLKTYCPQKHSPFLLKVLQCIVIINQSFTIKLKWPIETNSFETILPPLIKTGVAGTGDNIHLAF